MYFEDYFESYIPGNVTPTGMTVSGNSVVLASGTGIDDTQCWSGQIFAWRDESSFVDNITIFQALKRTSAGDQNANNFLQLWNASNPFNINAPVGNALFHVVTEIDSTLSFYIGNTTDFAHLLGNTGSPNTGADPYAMTQNIWFTMQANLQFGTTFIGTTTLLCPTLQADIIINGTTLISTNLSDPSIVIQSLPTPLAAVNVPLWNLSGYQFDSMTYEALTTANNYPHLNAARQARYSQGVTEVQELIDNSAARLSQGAVEIQKLPNDSFARCSQLVIELMLRTIRTGNWRVYEA